MICRLQNITTGITIIVFFLHHLLPSTALTNSLWLNGWLLLFIALFESWSIWRRKNVPPKIILRKVKDGFTTIKCVHVDSPIKESQSFLLSTPYGTFYEVIITYYPRSKPIRIRYILPEIRAYRCQIGVLHLKQIWHVRFMIWSKFINYFKHYMHTYLWNVKNWFELNINPNIK